MEPSIRNRRRNNLEQVSQLVADVDTHVESTFSTLTRNSPTLTSESSSGGDDERDDYESYAQSDSTSYHGSDQPLTEHPDSNNNDDDDLESSGDGADGGVRVGGAVEQARITRFKQSMSPARSSTCLGRHKNGRVSVSARNAICRRSHRRHRGAFATSNCNDNDHDGDIDNSDGKEDDDGKCDGSIVYDSNCNSDSDLNKSDNDNKKHTSIGSVNRWRQGPPNFLRPRMQPRNKQQDVNRLELLSAADSNNGKLSSSTLADRVNNSDEIYTINNGNHQHFTPLSRKKTSQPFIQCSDSGSSIVGRSILFLKDHLSRPFIRQKLPQQHQGHQQQLRQNQQFHLESQKNCCTAQSTDIDLHDQPTKMPSDNNYQALSSYNDEHRRYSRPGSSGSRLRENQRLSSGNVYSKLNHHSHMTLAQPVSYYQDIRRFFLLLILITVSCLLLWQLYEVLIGEYNYLGAVETSSELGKYKHYAVSTDAQPCAKVGSALLAKGGSAVDAAIGTLLCMGVVIPNSMGLGGGCLMTLYDGKTKQATVIDGREVAPDYATENMFANDSLKASRGPLSIGIPGELAAYWKAHQMYGKLNWSELFDETIDMAENGSSVVEHLAYALRAKSHAQYITPIMAKLFINLKTGEYYDHGEIIKQPALANTLRRIRDNGAKEFYGGLTGQLFIKDLQEQGGNITMENLMKYEALVKKPLTIALADDLTVHTQPPPGSGVVLSIILRIMKGLGYYKGARPQVSLSTAGLYYHRLIEAFKFAYAQRAGLEDKPDDPERMEKLMAKLISDEFINQALSKIDNQTHNDDRYGGLEYFSEDHGTAHVSVLDSEGNAAAVTTSVNLYFGSGLLSPSTGITYNDVMDDFVSPNQVNKFNLAPSKFNRIRPGKRPLSSMAPSVFTDANGNVRLVIGGSGGAKITTAIASVSLRNCFLGEDVKTATDGPRLHHQFLPNKIWYEGNFPKELLHSLIDRGHALQPITDRSSVIMSVASDQTNATRYITANSDYRKGGSVCGL